MTNVEAKVFPIEVLREFCARVFMHFQVPESDAMQAADVLAAADLRGIDSHGVARMSSYVDLLGEANQSQTADQVGEVDAEHCDR